MSNEDTTPEFEQDVDQIEEEEVEEETEDEESEEESEDQTAEELEELRKKNAELVARLRRETKKKNKPTKTITRDEPEVLSRVERLELSEKKRQFGYLHGLSPDETDKIFQINPDPSEETLKDPFVKAGLQALRKQKRASDNMPSGSGVSGKASLGKDFKDLSPQEKQERYAKMMARHIK